jgi:hypothetical protein
LRDQAQQPILGWTDGPRSVASGGPTVGFDGLVSYASGDPIEMSIVDGLPGAVARLDGRRGLLG